ncbi:hypothetical protein L596_024274 [Steinernema carpocapsae]|uniref:Uncharacterized protein n=1 Tax=Steinernema carpocapsae TaxID=34508 RepID=A0A4U5MGZ6_STECR|nr:hypothetical protein L596_024274 [Steinernema carpocapsae]
MLILSTSCAIVGAGDPPAPQNDALFPGRQNMITQKDITEIKFSKHRPSLNSPGISDLSVAASYPCIFVGKTGTNCLCRKRL